MALTDVTDPTAVLKTIAEADALGRQGFLAKYGFRPSREYFLQYEGRLYDSKAIVGVAHGHQHPAAGPLTAREFSGGERTVQQRLEQLGFTVVVSPTGPGESVDWNLKPGDKIRRVELHERYGGGSQGGISPSARTPNVLVFSESKAGEKYGYVYDGWRDGIFHYTGEGQLDDQLMRAGNLAIRDHEEDRRAIRVFNGVRGTVEYVGEFRQAGPPYYAEAPDRNAKLRQVIVFQLAPVDGPPPNQPGPPALVPASETIISETPVEQHQTPSMVVQPATEPWVATRREQRLVRDFQAWLEARGHLVVRLRALPIGETAAVVCDMFDRTANTVFEAKGTGTRNSIRMAIGQLADYGRFAPSPGRRAILLSERPRPDLETLLEGEGIAAVWRTEDAFTDNVGGQLVD